MIHDRTSQRPPRAYDPTRGDRRKFTFTEAVNAAHDMQKGVDVAIYHAPLQDPADAAIVPTFVIQALEAPSPKEDRRALLIMRAIARVKRGSPLLGDAPLLAEELDRLRKAVEVGAQAARQRQLYISDLEGELAALRQRLVSQRALGELDTRRRGGPVF